MNLKQLTAFHEVMLTGSVSKAAQNLLRTQPAISALIAGLENNLGLKLFQRRGGRLHPVPEAHYLFDEARAIIDRLKSTERIMKSIRDLDRGSIRMVAMPGPSVFLLPDLVSRFAENRKEVKVSLITRSSQQVQQLVSAQQYDVGLGDLGFDDWEKSPLVDHEVMNFGCVCALHADDPLAKKPAITPNDLSGKPMAALYKGHPTHDRTASVFTEANATFNMQFEVQYFIPMFTLIEGGLAFAIVDPLSAHSYKMYRGDKGKVVFRPFSPAVYLQVSIMTPVHRPASNLAHVFIGQLRRELVEIKNAY